MENKQHQPKPQRVNDPPDAGQALTEANTFLRQLIALPDSQSVGPLSLISATGQNQPMGSDPVDSVVTDVSAPVTSIVEQAAAVLDEEMAKGVVAARDGASARSQTQSNSISPNLNPLQGLVENLAALLPNLQGEPRQGRLAQQNATGSAETLVTISPRSSVRPGDSATLSMTLSNSENHSVHLVPVSTDLLGSRGGQIPTALLKFEPEEITLAPLSKQDLTISLTLPVDLSPGRYSGLLLVKGPDYLAALIVIDVASTATHNPESPLNQVTQNTLINPFSTQKTAPSSSMLSEHNAGSIVDSHDNGTGRDPPRTSSSALPITPSNRMMLEAIRLTKDGELGNSDAISLLLVPHSPEDVKEVLARFEGKITREAKSKLIREAIVPLPSGIDNQRYEPIFDRHPISGKTYSTASGTVALNEIQYYNGELVQFFGECPNVTQVQQELAGSGYKPLRIKRADGHECAIVQFWAHKLSDTSLWPYDASFVIIAAVPEDTPETQSCYVANENGMASVLPMFDGTFDMAGEIYENRPKLFFVRLLDSTQVAIEIGRERMGTDKRAGTVDMKHTGNRRSVSVTDGAGNSVATIDVVIANDDNACLADVARAAATAGLPFQSLPAGTEFVYPGVARIGVEPVVEWQWRTDLLPNLQRVEPNSIKFDSRSEEGEMLLRWGFKPKLLGHIPNMRGVITGLT